VLRNGRYMPPTAPGYSIEMHPESLTAHEYPHGAMWSGSV
jgi:L-fuconate dehydratase